jgi:RNA polymerase sigma-70 factor, ECF subfamily
MNEERVLIQRAQAGDQEAFGGLVRAYQGPVYNLAYRMLGTPMEAEEAVQETFLRVYRGMKSYDPQQKLSSWILAIASHYCVDRLRRRRMTWLSLEDAPAAALAETTSEAPERGFLDREKEQEMQQLLSSLPETYRVVLVLRYWQDLSYEEIAEMLGSTESAVKSRLHRARELMADFVARQQTEQSSKRVERRVAGHALP